LLLYSIGAAQDGQARLQNAYWTLGLPRTGNWLESDTSRAFPGRSPGLVLSLCRPPHERSIVTTLALRVRRARHAGGQRDPARKASKTRKCLRFI